MATKLNLHKLMSRDEGYLRKLRVAGDDVATLSEAREEIRDTLRQAFRSWRTYLRETDLRDTGVTAAVLPTVLPSPKFRIQGSFAYFTANDCQNPPRQQVDQDDGVFLPLSFVMVGGRERPTIASAGYFALVEKALAPLCAERGWILNPKVKNSCVRVQLNDRLHIDLPLYAVRDNAFERLVETAATTTLEKSLLRDSRELDERIYKDLLGAELILAHRKEGWIQSDPRVLETWFKNAIDLYGDVVRDLSRAFKGLRDAKFDDGLSSICIMALVVRSVEQLGQLDPNRFDLALVDVAREIARNLQQPVANPAFPDDASKHLCWGWDADYRAKVRTLFADAADQLEEGIDGTYHRTIAVQKARAAYGARVPKDEALVSANSAASIVRSAEPQPQPKPVVPRTKSGLSKELLRAVIAAVEADGFRPKLIGEALRLEGAIAVGGRQVPLRLEFQDLTLAEGPRLILPDLSLLGRKVTPHVDENGELCAVDRQLFVFDRYQAPELTRGLIVRAREVLERGLTKEGTREIAEEFPSYWSTDVLPVSIDDGSLALQNFAVLKTNVRVSFANDQGRPTNLSELIDWLAAWDSRLGAQLTDQLARLSVADPTIIIRAPNASIAATLLVSDRGSAFMKSLSRPQAWARYAKSGSARQIAILRRKVPACDLRSVLGRDHADGRPVLAGKRLTLVGCGSIGGYLARMLVQLGAGFDAPFVIIDKDTLSHSNIRRHQLGMAEVNLPKAEALAGDLTRDFPGVEIRAIGSDATKRARSLFDAQLVIDATGEQGFSEWLNEQWLIEWRAERSPPPILYVWIAGTGQAAQAFMVQDREFACYRCLQPGHAEQNRFDPLRAPSAAPVAGCGEQPSMAYGPASPTSAASLALTAVSDWAQGRAHPLLRTVRINWKETVKRDPCSPQRSKRCPACGRD